MVDFESLSKSANYDRCQQTSDTAQERFLVLGKPGFVCVSSRLRFASCCTIQIGRPN
jgi:hypothetical protein